MFSLAPTVEKSCEFQFANPPIYAILTHNTIAKKQNTKGEK